MSQNTWGHSSFKTFNLVTSLKTNYHTTSQEALPFLHEQEWWEAIVVRPLFLGYLIAIFRICDNILTLGGWNVPNEPHAIIRMWIKQNAACDTFKLEYKNSDKYHHSNCHHRCWYANMYRIGNAFVSRWLKCRCQFSHWSSISVSAGVVADDVYEIERCLVKTLLTTWLNFACSFCSSISSFAEAVGSCYSQLKQSNST